MKVYRGCAFPEDLLYDVEQDVWIRCAPDGTVTCGMTDPAQTRCGQVVIVSFREVGRHIPRGRPLAVVESGTWLGPVLAPLSGTISLDEAPVDGQTCVRGHAFCC